YYSISAAKAQAAPQLLTPGDGEVEQVSFSNDGRWLYYAANIGDLDRRNLWRVPVAGGTAEKLTKAPGLDTFPVVLASGEQVAVMHAETKRPLLVALVATQGGALRTITKAPAQFPADLHVEPQAVEVTAADGLKSHAQIFLPPDLK